MNELEKLLSATEKSLDLAELAEETIDEVLNEMDIHTEDEKLKQLLIDELDKKYGDFADTELLEGNAIDDMVKIAQSRDNPEKFIRKNILVLLNQLYNHDNKVLNYVTSIVNSAIDSNRLNDISTLVTSMMLDNIWNSVVPVDDVMEYLEVNRGVKFSRTDSIKDVIDNYMNRSVIYCSIREYLKKKEIKYYGQMLEELTEIYIRYNQNSKFTKDSFEHQMLVVLEDYRLEHIDEYSVSVNETPEYIANLEKEYSELQKNTEEMNSIIKKYKTISIVGTFTAVASLTTSIVLAVKLINKRRK